MNRVRTQLAAMAASAALGAAMVGLVPLVVGGAVVCLGLVSLARRPTAGPAESPWRTPGPRREQRSDRPSSTARVVRSLGTVEVRELALSPWVGLGLGACIVMVISFASGYDGHEAWWQIVDDLPFLAHPFIGMVVLAAHRAATRARRDGADELFASCPAGRLVPYGVLASSVLPAAITLVFLAGYLAVVAGATTVDGRLGTGAVILGLSVVPTAMGGVALGAALARFVRNPLAPIVALTAIAVASPRLAQGDPGEMSPHMLLSTMTGISEGVPPLSPGQAWFHLMWLTGLGVVTAGVAALPPRRPAVAVDESAARAGGYLNLGSAR